MLEFKKIINEDYFFGEIIEVVGVKRRVIMRFYGGRSRLVVRCLEIMCRNIEIRF